MKTLHFSIILVLALTMFINYDGVFAQITPLLFKSPLEQFKEGMSIDNITCKQNYVLVTKSENHSPACMKLETAQNLVIRGWGQIVVSHIVIKNSGQNLTNVQLVTPTTYDIHGTVHDALSLHLKEIASISSGMQISHTVAASKYDNGNIKLGLYYGTNSSSDVISVTVDNVSTKAVHVYGINIQGSVPISNNAMNSTVVLQARSDIIPKENSILRPGESQTKYIVGNWIALGKSVSGFSASISYSYEKVEDFNGITNGFTMYVPIQWIK